MEHLRTYFRSLNAQERISYAASCGTTVNYINKILSIKPKLDGALCRLLDINSGGVVKKQLLRPDIWPELTAMSDSNNTDDLTS